MPSDVGNRVVDIRNRSVCCIIDRQRTQATDRGDPGGDVTAGKAMDNGYVQSFFPLGQCLLFKLSRCAPRYPDPESADLLQGCIPRLRLRLIQAGREQVVKRLESLDPASRRRVNCEPIKNAASRRDRAHPISDRQVPIVGPQCGQRLDPLLGLSVGVGHRWNFGPGRGTRFDERNRPRIAIFERLVEVSQRTLLIDG